MLGDGRMMSRSGLEKRAEREAACAEMGVSMARFLRGRLERGSAEVGTDSGMFSDILYAIYQAGRLSKYRVLMEMLP